MGLEAGSVTSAMMKVGREHWEEGKSGKRAPGSEDGGKGEGPTTVSELSSNAGSTLAQGRVKRWCTLLVNVLNEST